VHHSAKLPAGSERARERILVVDDDPGARKLASILLEQHGYAVQLAGCAQDLRACFGSAPPDVVLLDWRLPDGDGLELLAELQSRWPETPVVMLTGEASFDLAVDAVKRGVFHFHAKPFQAKVLLRILREACQEGGRRRKAAAETARKSNLPLGLNGPIFASVPMQELRRLVERVAASEASILITGESGTGKEVIADLIHAQSARAKGPMVKVNCAALPRELMESELFGCVKGAFTGAHADREGLFHQARGGTLMLDEISEMPLEMQSKLLRVLQHKEYRPVGATTTLQADCRVIAATNRRVEDALNSHKLRADLFYRISTITLHVPPLRERRAAILPLAQTFLERYAQLASRKVPALSTEAVAALEDFHWPGNVRQLENEIHRAVLVCEGAVVRKRDLFFTQAAAGPPALRQATRMADLEMNAILDALKVHSGNKTAAARHLGLTRQTLYNKLRQYGLEVSHGQSKPKPCQRDAVIIPVVFAGRQ
jgi:DNA-binding NtrC family response regulator